MAKSTKPRLGRGLSSLLGDPVKVPTEGPTSRPIQLYSTRNLEPPATAGSPDEGMDRRLIEAPLDEIVPSPFQPRAGIDDATLTQLADSIRAAGVMQPILVRPASGGGYELVAGERRWRAARLAGLTHAPVIVVELEDEEAASWALVENVHREDLGPMERGRALRMMAERFGLSHGRVAERVGLERSSVTNLIRLTDLEPEIQSMLEGGGEHALTAGHGKALLAIAPGAARLRLAKRAARGAWSVRRLEREVASRGEPEPGEATPKDGADDGLVRELERQIGEQLGTRVRVVANRDRSKGRLVIEFYGVEHFDGLIERLGVRVDV
jgi:ParB family chromosome partitioning protein